MSWYKEIATNTLFQVLARIASSGSSFLITIIVARHFGISSYGDFAKANAFVTLFYLFADFGLNAMFLQRADAKMRFKELLYTRLFLAVALMLVVNLIGTFLPYNQATQIGFSPLTRLGISLFSITIITEAIVYTAGAVFQRELSYEYLMIATVIGSMSTLFFVIISTFFASSILFVLLSYVLGGVVESGLALFFTKEGVLPVRIDVVFVKRLARDTLPVTLMLVFNLVYFRIDLILLSLLKPSTDVALYDFSYKFFDFLIALPLFLSNALYPSILKKEKDEKNFLPTVKRYLLFFAVFAVFVLIPAWIFAPLLRFVKSDFSQAVIPLRILLLSLPVFFATSILQWVLLAKKQQVFLAGVYFFSTIANIVLNVIFIPQYSYIAASVITGISELVVFLALWGKLFFFTKNK